MSSNIDEHYRKFVKFLDMQANAKRVRKHRWLPCLLNERIDWDNITTEEYKNLQKQTKWLDRLRNKEYEYLFNNESLSKSYVYSIRSTLKKKLKEWLMVTSTIWYFDHDLWLKAMKQAKEEYEEQTGRPFVFEVKEPTK